MRVVWGLSETIATFASQSTFTRVDLPTFGRPARTTWPLRMGQLLRGPDAADCRHARHSVKESGNSSSRVRTASRPRQGKTDALDAEFEQPLPAGAAGGGGDCDGLDVAGLTPAATAHASADRSAQSVSPYEAFSTFAPVKTRPSRASTAAPTRKPEYGA